MATPESWSEDLHGASESEWDDHRVAFQEVEENEDHEIVEMVIPIPDMDQEMKLQNEARVARRVEAIERNAGPRPREDRVQREHQRA